MFPQPSAPKRRCFDPSGGAGTPAVVTLVIPTSYSRYGAGALALPRGFPSLPAILSLVELGAVGTGSSLLIYFRLIANVGATRTSTVTYLVPVWALLYGAVLLGEEITAHAILILIGDAGASGIASLPRKQPPEETPDGPGR